MRSAKGRPYLVANPPSRKNLTCGVIMKRPCIFGLNTEKARLVRPVHSLWPAAQARVFPGERLFSAANRRDFNRRLDAILDRLEAPHAARYRSHAFRRGSDQEMNETGSPLSAVASAGMWRSNAMVKNYIDLAATVETNFRQLHRVDFDSDSEMEVRPALGLGRNLLYGPARPLFPWVSGILVLCSPIAFFQIDSARLKAGRI